MCENQTHKELQRAYPNHIQLRDHLLLLLAQVVIQKAFAILYFKSLWFHFHLWVQDHTKNVNRINKEFFLEARLF